MKNRVKQLTSQIETTPDNAQLYFERALLHYKSSDLRAAYNDFVKADLIDNTNPKVKHYIEAIDIIFSFGHRESYNV